MPWFAITVARWLVVCAACSASAPRTAPQWPPAKRATGPSHDPDHARGELPAATTRQTELAGLRHDLDTMYAHRLAKLARYHLDEDQIFRDAEKALLAADSWAKYDSALYETLAEFHDGHLGYRPPQTAAPARGYTSYRLGLRTVLAHDHLLISEVDAGSDVAAAGVLPGDEVTAIDKRPIADVLAAQSHSRADARPESALVQYAKTWTSVLIPKGDTPRVHPIDVAKRAGGTVHIDIKPQLPAPGKHEVVSVAHAGDIAIVTIKSLEGGKSRAAAIDTALAEARGAKGIVLDLRGNRGGIDKVGFRVVADLAEGTAKLGEYRVLAAPETLARRPQWKGLVAEADGFSPVQPLTVPALAKRYAGKIAVVVDAGCISTCEVVVAALRADLGAILIGDITGGSSGAPVSVTLPASKGSVQIPTWNLVAADGKPIEDDGVAPD
ncbi:MAG TPA: S41 family peptidase, partial [Kofleriaceae bacterium]|nr:S41 family peptidase [Kofleriaceae bacterium]